METIAPSPQFRARFEITEDVPVERGGIISPAMLNQDVGGRSGPSRVDVAQGLGRIDNGTLHAMFSAEQHDQRINRKPGAAMVDQRQK